ncbi:MAG: hypothetical protein U0326_05190 [Polyangiales bacterium]
MIERNATTLARASWTTLALLLAGCGDDGLTGAPPTYPGTDTLGATPVAAPFTASTNTPRTVQVSLSSETLGQQGFAYTPTPAAGDLVFVDGWEVRFSRILVTVKNVRLNARGASASDPAAVGASVALNPRAYAVNAHAAGPLTGASGGEETAIPLFVFTAADSGAALDAATRYALSYDVVAATRSATNVNLDAGDLTAYESMISHGWTQLIEGTATYRGVAPAAESPLASYPTTVRFSFGFGAPARYMNCQNPDNGADDAPGVQPSAVGRARAQLTFHMDHAFWEALNREDPPLHFDAMAARATGTGAMATLSLDDLAGVAPTNLRDRMNRPVPDRGAQTAGYTPRNPAALSYDPAGASGINDLRDFVAFSARASAHLNADGLCAVRPSGPITW